MHIWLSLWVKDYLGKTFSVAKVDEYQITVVAIGMDPSGKGNLFAGVIEPEPAAIMCSFEHCKISLYKKSVRLSARAETPAEQDSRIVTSRQWWLLRFDSCPIKQRAEP